MSNEESKKDKWSFWNKRLGLIAAIIAIVAFIPELIGWIERICCGIEQEKPDLVVTEVEKPTKDFEEVEKPTKDFELDLLTDKTNKTLFFPESVNCSTEYNDKITINFVFGNGGVLPVAPKQKSRMSLNLSVAHFEDGAIDEGIFDENDSDLRKRTDVVKRIRKLPEWKPETEIWLECTLPNDYVANNFSDRAVFGFNANLETDNYDTEVPFAISVKALIISDKLKITTEVIRTN